MLVAYFHEEVRRGWELVAILIAGYGFVVVARWFWWRINAWAEMSALVGSGVGTLIASHVIHFETFGTRFFFVGSVSTAAWVIVSMFAMFLFAPLLEPAMASLHTQFFGWLDQGLGALER